LAGESRYFPLSMESLRSIGGWAADCAERALAAYEGQAGSDSRPRAAIEGIRAFAGGGRRSAQLRGLALAAFAAGREAGNPLADVQQTKHIAGPAAYAALALELDQGGDPAIGDQEVIWAVEHAPPEVSEVLLQMPARAMGRSRLENIMYEIDAGIRARNRLRGT
jgi:hypothetical protein